MDRSADRGKAGRPGWLRPVLAASLFVLLLCGFARVSSGDLRPSDDNVWLYLTGVQLLSAPAAGALDRDLLGVVAERGAERESALRYRMRAEYRGNYLLPSLSYGLLGRLFGNGDVSGLEDYGRQVGITFLAGAVGWYAAAAAALALGAAATRRTDLLAGLLGAVLLVCLGALLQPEPGSFLFFRRQGWTIVENMMQFIVNPGGQQSILGFTPRNTLFLLVLLVFCWRWAGWWRAAYALAFASLLVHQSMAGMLMVALVGLDLALRPVVFRDPLTAAWPVAAIVALALRETLWDYVAVSPLLVAAALAGVLLLGAAAAAVAFEIGPGRPTSRLLRRWWQWIGERPAHATDSLMLLAGWLVTLPVSYAVSQHVDLIEGTYFWYQVHARLLAEFQPVMLFGLATAALRGSMERPPRMRLLAAAAATAAAAGIAATLHRPPAVEPFLDGLAELGGRLQERIVTAPDMSHEAVIYMAMARALDTGDRSVFDKLVETPGRAPGSQ